MQQRPIQQSAPWGQQEMPACVKEFLDLRDNVEKRAKAVQASSSVEREGKVTGAIALEAAPL